MTLQFPFGPSVFFPNPLWHCQLCVASATCTTKPAKSYSRIWWVTQMTHSDRQLSMGLVNCPHCCFTNGQPRNESSSYVSGWAESTYLRVCVSHKALGKQLRALPARLPGMELILLLKSSSSTAFLGLVCLLSSSSCGPQIQLMPLLVSLWWGFQLLWKERKSPLYVRWTQEISLSMLVRITSVFLRTVMPIKWSQP